MEVLIAVIGGPFSPSKRYLLVVPLD